jgi:hypothetical protein
MAAQVLHTFLVLCNRKGRYRARARRSPPLATSWASLTRFTPSHLVSLRFIIISSHFCLSPKRSVSQGFSCSRIKSIFSSPCLIHSCSSHPPSFHHPNNIRWRAVPNYEALHSVIFFVCMVTYFLVWYTTDNILSIPLTTAWETFS